MGEGGGGVLVWVRKRDERCPCPTCTRRCGGGGDLSAWVRDKGEGYLWGPLSLLVAVS